MADGAEGLAAEAAGSGTSGDGIPFSPELAEALCARLAAGGSIMGVCRDPKMPHRTTVRRWANRRPTFAAELLAAMRQSRTVRRLRNRASASERANRPPPIKGGKPSSYTAEMGEAICSRIANGESVVKIASDPDMPCAGTIYGWARRHPEFEEMYVRAREVQADYLFDEAREVALSATPGGVWVSRLQFDTIRWMTARMAPKVYCERLVVDAGIAVRKAEEDPDKQGLTVIVKRFSDVTPEEEEAARLTEEGWFDRPRGRLGRS